MNTPIPEAADPPQGIEPVRPPVRMPGDGEAGNEGSAGGDVGQAPPPPEAPAFTDPSARPGSTIDTADSPTAAASGVANAPARDVPESFTAEPGPAPQRLPPPPPPPLAPLPAPISLELAPPNITVVTTADELVQAMEDGALDIEIQDHIDARDLPFTDDTTDGFDLGCDDHYGSIDGACGYLMYMRNTRSLRGNCAGPPTAEVAQQLNLPESGVVGMQTLHPGQCVIVVSKAAIFTRKHNKWFDNLHFAIISDTLVPKTVVAISLSKETLPFTPATNVFLTRITFHALDGLSGARALAIAPELPENTRGKPGNQVEWGNDNHAVLFQECEFIGFSGDEPPLLIALDSYGTLQNCLFTDFDLTVEVFDVSYGGRLQLEDCTFQNIHLRRNPPKYVSTTENNQLRCVSPFEDTFKYNADDDDAYDIVPELLDPSDPSAGSYVQSAIISDCLRAINLCDFGMMDTPWPGCPAESVARRIWLNHNSCGRVIDPEDPEYYGSGISQSEWDSSDYAAAPAFVGLPAGAASGPAGDEYHADSFEAFCYESFPSYDEPGFTAFGTVYQHSFLDDQHPWFTALRDTLPENERVGEQRWSWPQAAQQAGNAPRDASATHLADASNGRECSDACIATAAVSLGVFLFMLCFAVLFLCRKRRQKRLAEDEGSLPAPWKSECSIEQTVSQSMRGRQGSCATGTDLMTTDIAHLSSCDNHLLNATSTPEGLAATCRNKNYTYQLKPGFSLAVDTPANDPQGAMQAQRASLPQEQGVLSGNSSMPTDVAARAGAWPQKTTTAKSAATPTIPEDSVNFSAIAQPTDSTAGASQHGDLNIASEKTSSTTSTPKEAITVYYTVSEETMSGPVRGVLDKGVAALSRDKAVTDNAINALTVQLDKFTMNHLFLEEFEMLGRDGRRMGGQAVVQFARRRQDGREYAVKFFMDRDAFYREAALYAAYFPALRKLLKNAPSDGGGSVPAQERIGGARFLPHVEAVCDSAATGGVDPNNAPLPPCIVMERGESLQDWSNRAEPDRFTSLSVLENIAARMKDMHEAGYVHRDLKPANVVLLPRENRWTVIDFGCAARTWSLAPLAFSLTYSPPEVIRMAEVRETCMEASAAVDVWALGVMAFELLTGSPAFRIVTDGVEKVIAALRGDEELPWEGRASEARCAKLGSLRAPILAMLHRDPSLRPSMAKCHSYVMNMDAR